MRRRFWISLAVLAGLCVLGWAVAGSVNRALHRTNALPGLRRLVQFISPLDDLYEPVVLEAIDVSQGAAQSYAAAHRYAGRYFLGIVLPEDTSDTCDSRLLDYQIDVRFYDEDKELLHRAVRDGGSCFWGPEGDGVQILTYLVPQDVPLDTVLRVDIQIQQPGVLFGRESGQHSIYIGKVSEE